MTPSLISYFESIPNSQYIRLGNDFEIPIINSCFNEGGEQCFSLNSKWNALRTRSVRKIVDGQFLGGATPKSILYYDPPQMKEGNINKKKEQMIGIFKPYFSPEILQKKGHLENTMNEILGFHADCLLQLKRTPPVTLISLPTEKYQNSLSQKSLNMILQRFPDIFEKVPLSKNNSSHDPNSKLIQETEYKYPRINGTVQLYVPSVSKRNELTTFFEPLFDSLFMNSISPNKKRELMERVVFDYLIGNWDRKNNYFYVRKEKTEPPSSSSSNTCYSFKSFSNFPSSTSRNSLYYSIESHNHETNSKHHTSMSESSSLIFLDHNHLIFKRIPFIDFCSERLKIKLSYLSCHFPFSLFKTLIPFYSSFANNKFGIFTTQLDLNQLLQNTSQISNKHLFLSHIIFQKKMPFSLLLRNSMYFYQEFSEMINPYIEQKLLPQLFEYRMIQVYHYMLNCVNTTSFDHVFVK